MTRTITLPDGRTMAWEEYGAADGRPVLFLHGTPGGRLSAAKYEPFALARGLRLVAPDRPGYGLSTARPGMTLSDYAEALLDLCWWRGWGPVPVVAGSAGAAYALALGAAASEMVTGVSIFSGIAPMTDDEATTLIPVNQQLRSAVNDPSELERLVGQVRDAILAGTLEGVPEDPALTDALKPGADGMVADYLNVFGEWGLDPVAVRVPVFWIHGTADVNAPISAARRLVAQLPEARVAEVSGGVHAPSAETLDRVFDATP